MLLFNPKNSTRRCPDEASQKLIAKTVEFFENKGKEKIKEDERNRVWYRDFLDFAKENKLFATLLSPPDYGGEGSGWNTWRNCELAEILGFYGLPYWYTWQVSVLGLGPIWMSDNEEAKKKAAKLLDDGEVFAFGLSEKEHGADVYSTDMTLAPKEGSGLVANGSKYYIGNGNEAPMVSTFGKMQDSGDYVFFAADYRDRHYECVKNVVSSQNYVSEFKLTDYPVSDSAILSKGQEAWNSALNTVNIGKYNLGWASIGMCTHSMYEAVKHAANRVLYGMHVTDFPHVKRLFTDAYSRLTAMKLFALRASDYMRSASPEDRRYLLFNPVVKMKVTTQGEEVMNLMWDVIAAKGFESDMFFEMAAKDIRALPKLEGTVHVNIALIVKFMKNYFFAPKDYAEVPNLNEPGHDEFLFRQGPTRGLSKIQFHDYTKAYKLYDTPNVAIFREQIDIFKGMLFQAAPTDDQQKDIDLLLSVGEIFTLVVYGQLILENAKLHNLDVDHVDQMFDCFVRDFSKFALDVFSKPSTTEKQQEFCKKMIRKPAVDTERYSRMWNDHVLPLKDAYELRP